MKPGLSRLSTIFAAAVMAAGTLATPAFAQQASPEVPAKAPTTILIPAKALPTTLPPGIIMLPTKPRDDTKKAELPPFPFTKTMLDETDGGKRIVRVEGAITSASAAVIEAQLIALDKADPGKPILLAINSPGGEVQAGVNIIDTMNSLQSPVYTVGFNMCASMAGVLLASGESGHRSVFPGTNILLHELSAGGIEGKISDQEQILADERREENKLLSLLAEHSGQTQADILTFIHGRDRWVPPEQARRYGFIDSVEQPSHPVVPPKHIERLRTLDPA
jgi:ATP-dependent Clp protease, protease subunit